MIDEGKDGEMESKWEYRGKGKYMDGDYSDKLKNRKSINKLFL